MIWDTLKIENILNKPDVEEKLQNCARIWYECAFSGPADGKEKKTAQRKLAKTRKRRVPLRGNNEKKKAKKPNIVEDETTLSDQDSASIATTDTISTVTDDAETQGETIDLSNDEDKASELVENVLSLEDFEETSSALGSVEQIRDVSNSVNINLIGKEDSITNSSFTSPQNTTINTNSITLKNMNSSTLLETSQMRQSEERKPLYEDQFGTAFYFESNPKDYQVTIKWLDSSGSVNKTMEKSKSNAMLLSPDVVEEQREKSLQKESSSLHSSVRKESNNGLVEVAAGKKSATPQGESEAPMIIATPAVLITSPLMSSDPPRQNKTTPVSAKKTSERFVVCDKTITVTPAKSKLVGEKALEQNEKTPICKKLFHNGENERTLIITPTMQTKKNSNAPKQVASTIKKGPAMAFKKNLTNAKSSTSSSVTLTPAKKLSDNAAERMKLYKRKQEEAALRRAQILAMKVKSAKKQTPVCQNIQPAKAINKELSKQKTTETQNKSQMEKKAANPLLKQPVNRTNQLLTPTSMLPPATTPIRSSVKPQDIKDPIAFFKPSSATANNDQSVRQSFVSELTFIKEKNNEDSFENYEMTTVSDSTSEEDEEEREVSGKQKKKIPNWAKDVEKNSIQDQSLFKSKVKNVRISEIFGDDARNGYNGEKSNSIWETTAVDD